MKESNKLTKWALTIVRTAIGWHFLYEGVAKIMSSGWSSAAYLTNSKWIFSPLFQWMAGNSAVIAAVDFLNIWGMILVGLGLITGLFARWAAAGGTLMLLFYFVAYPPIPGYMVGVPAEGSYLWINKTLIELFVLLAFVFIPATNFFGLDRLYARWKEEKARQPVPEYSGDNDKKVARREMMKDLIAVPAIGAFAYALYKKRRWDSFEEKLLKVEGIDANSGATTLNFSYASLSELKGKVPKGKITYRNTKGEMAEFELSRLIMGGNLIGGWAHSRDLIYVSKLVKTYHTDEKVMQTLALGEKCGMNSIITNPQLGRILKKYKHEFRSNLKYISDCGVGMDFQKGIKLSLLTEADALYCQGEITDRWTNPEYDDGRKLTVAQRMELIREGLEESRSHGKPAGIGAHRIEAIKVCVEHGLQPDFWVKTCHSHNYWSAKTTAEWNDNMFDFDPDETVRYMETLEQPWIAFKVLAAGAIKPEDGLKYAFNSGADFVCMGMYDFQIVEDANHTLAALANVQRARPWRG